MLSSLNGAVKVDAQLFKVSTNRQVWATEQMIPRDPKFFKRLVGYDELDCLHFGGRRSRKEIINLYSIIGKWKWLRL